MTKPLGTVSQNLMNSKPRYICNWNHRTHIFGVMKPCRNNYRREESINVVCCILCLCECIWQWNLTWIVHINQFYIVECNPNGMFLGDDNFTAFEFSKIEGLTVTINQIVSNNEMIHAMHQRWTNFDHTHTHTENETLRPRKRKENVIFHDIQLLFIRTNQTTILDMHEWLFSMFGLWLQPPTRSQDTTISLSTCIQHSDFQRCRSMQIDCIWGQI